MTTMSMRRAWFQVHKWIGLALAVLIIPLSLTGAALVWDEPLDRMLNPANYAVTGQSVTSIDRYVAAARGVIAPGQGIVSLRLPEGDGPVILQAAQVGKAPGGRPDAGQARGGPPQRTTIYLDPPTAHVLGIGKGGGLLRAFHMIHGSLLVPGVGRQIVGWIGVAMMVSAFTGLWLWWPSVGRWARGLRWRRRPNVDANLHHLFGFWIALPLFVLSLTGAWISFPAFFGMVDGGAARSGAGARPPGRPQPLARPRMTASEAVSAAMITPDAVEQIAWPTDQKPQWTVSIADGRVAVTDGDGTAKRLPAERETTARLMRRIHDGTGMGFLWQAIIFLGGLIPAGLAITGVIMWWRARNWRDKASDKRSAATAQRRALETPGA